MYAVDDKLNFDASRLTYREAIDLEEFARAIVTKGFIDMNNPAWVVWYKATGYENRELLTYSTVFPQRALIAVIDYCNIMIATE